MRLPRKKPPAPSIGSDLSMVRASDLKQPSRRGAKRMAIGRWGNWHLDKSALAIDYIKDVEGDGYRRRIYQIDLEDLGTPARMLDWIMQVDQKTWASRKDIGDLVQAFHDIFQPQATLCSMGVAKRINDIAAFLRKSLA